MTRSEKPDTGPAATIPPEIAWGTTGAPHSGRFDDMYFNPENGLAETEHVFLHGTGFPERWRAPGARRIGELGFGLGLNFLAACRSWRDADAPPFDYTAFEIAPPDAGEIRRALAPWPELAGFTEQLCAVWPLESGAWVTLAPGGPRLRLFQGDARLLAPALAATEPGSLDTLFLDGFSPAKNPEMWDAALLDALYRLAAPGARAATFTAAGWVRRGLAAAGFDVRKAPGYGRKKERLIAEKPVG